MRRALCLLLALALPAAAQERPAPESTSAIDEHREVTATEFMVASAHPLATRAGYDVLAAGGSAADAAVAVQMVLTLVEPQSSGLGGGAFAVYWDAALGQLTTFDGRETAPAAATPEYWLGENGEPLEFWDAVVGGRSAGVPGTPKLMETLHARFGRLPWGELFAPAIALAEDGFPITPRLAAAIEEANEHALGDFPAAEPPLLPPGRHPEASGRDPPQPRPRPHACACSPPKAASRSTKARSPATSSPPSGPRPTPASSPSPTSPPTRSRSARRSAPPTAPRRSAAWARPRPAR